MTAKIINGKEIAQSILNDLKSRVETLDFRPSLAVIIAGDDHASRIYVKNKVKKAAEIGFKSVLVELSGTCTKEELLKTIDRLNDDPEITAILLQLPLPSHLKEDDFLDRILPEKDVDGFHSLNVGKLVKGGKTGVIPCTPKGIIKLLEGFETEGKNVVVAGRSNIVGKPVAALLLNKNATVTIIHSKTKNPAEITSKADILICATGKAKFFKKDMVKQGAVIIDVGICRGADGKLTGDVDFEDVKEKASAITPVPGGVGPMTIACLMENTLELALLAKEGK